MKFKLCTDNLCSKIFNYILLLGISFIFSLFLDYYIGVTFLLALIVLPIISAILTVFSIKDIQISFPSNNLTCNKGDEIDITVNLTSSSLIPIMHLSLAAKHSPNLNPTDLSGYTVALDKYSASSIHFKYQSIASGYAKIWIDDIIISDLTGWITFKAIDIPHQFSTEIGIIPQIQPILYDLNIINQSSNTYDSEDSMDTANNYSVQSGIAGYEHREYVPGDPLKRINWKLSAKTNEYMVRLDEPVTLNKHVLLLDPRSGGDILLNERIIESSLALIYNIIRSNQPAEIYLYEHSQWSVYYVNTLYDLETLQNTLSQYSFCPPENNPFTTADFTKGLNIILFTAYAITDGWLNELNLNYNITVVTSQENQSVTSDLLYIGSDLDIRRAL